MLTVKTVDHAGNEVIYEGDEVSRISPGLQNCAAPGVLVQRDGALVAHIGLHGEGDPGVTPSSDTVAAYVMNSAGATVAIYRA